MADFASNTQLSAPQGAGSQPLAPIQQVDNSRALLSGVSSIFGAVGDFAKAETDKAKVAAEQRKSSVLEGYTKKENSYAQAIEQGTMSASEALARSRANFREYSTNFADLAVDLEKQAKALKGNTEIGEAQKAQDDERSLYNKDKEAASSSGALFYPGMSKKAEVDQIIAHKTAVQEAKQLTERRAAASEARAQGTYDQGIDDRREKEASVASLQKIAGTHLESFQSFVTDVGEKVRSGKMLPDEGRALIAKRYNSIDAGLVSVSASNPSLASPFQSLFKEMKTLGDTLLDPKVAAEDAASQLKSLKTKSTLMLMANPKTRAAIMTNELFPNSPTAILQASPAVIEAFSMLADMDIKSEKFAPQVIGNPEIQGDFIKILKESIGALSGLPKDKQEKALEQAGNSANQLLKQANKYLDGGVDPKQMVGIADFFASEAYATLVNSGKIDKEAALAASKVMQISYTKTLINGVQKELSGYLFNPLDRSGKPSPHPRIPISDSVEAKFTGSGIVFLPKPLASIYPNQTTPLGIEQNRQAEVIKNLNTSQKAINRLIHIGAHMEGTTDYAGFWEKHKHEMLPSMFAAPKTEGQTAAPAAAPNYGMREDGTAKGSGWLGELKVPGTRDIATEYSVTVEIDGKDVLLPTLIPGLSQQEVDSVLDSVKKGKLPPEAVIDKAVIYAEKRIKEGKSPFATPEEAAGIKAAPTAESSSPKAASMADIVKFAKEKNLPVAQVLKDFESNGVDITGN